MSRQSCVDIGLPTISFLPPVHFNTVTAWHHGQETPLTKEVLTLPKDLIRQQDIAKFRHVQWKKFVDRNGYQLPVLCFSL